MTEAQAPVKTVHHMKRAASVRGIRSDVQKVKGFNAKLAVVLTNVVGSMACAYVFSLLALVSLPAILTSGNFVSKDTFPHWLISVGLISLIAWIAQTFLQLVLLSVIMVGQNVQSLASDARAERTYEDTTKLIDLMDVHTQGGLKDLYDELVAHFDSKLQQQASGGA